MLRYRNSIFRLFKLRKYSVSANSRYAPGNEINGYVVQRILTVEELKLTAIELKHRQTGSEHLHIAKDDSNNVFSIGFKTNPPDATGVPHILEHTTLCGSEKYPVRDPFFKMLNKSLANFMNAMTAHDHTFYPFATTNFKDFKNLRSVYLDATLKPLLKMDDFYQEGWRLEHEQVGNAKSNIVFKGVVYNEMKGQMSNSNYHFWIKFQNAIYPALNNSGGDPQKITELTHEKLVEYHENFYHPSNSKTFTYGDFPLEDTLMALNNSFVGYGKRNTNDNDIKKPLDLVTDQKVVIQGHIDPTLPRDKQIRASITWKCGPTKGKIYETFVLKILGSLLLDGHSAPLYKALIDSQIGSEYSVNTGMESLTAENFFTIGVQGLDDVKKLEHGISTAFDEFMASPLDHRKVEAILQQMELSKRDKTTDFGIQLLYAVLPGWFNQIDVFEELAYNQIISRFKKEFEEKGSAMFHDILKKYIIQKPKLTFVVEGNENFDKELESEENERLEKKLTLLDKNDKEILLKRGLHLQELQDKKEDTSCLRSLKISDISRNGTYYDVNQKPSISYLITETNSLSYLRAKKSIDDVIPYEYYRLLPLFADALTYLGTSTESYSEIEEQIKLHTGGISIDFACTTDPVTLMPHLTLNASGWSLNSKSKHIFDNWLKILSDTDFRKHKEKLKVLIRMTASSKTASIVENGHSYAKGYSSAFHSTSSAIKEQLSGLTQINHINRISDQISDEHHLEEVISKLEEIQRIVVGGGDWRFFCTSDGIQQVKKLETEWADFRQALDNNVEPRVVESCKTSMFPSLEKGSKTSVLVPLPYQVSYTGKSLQCAPHVSSDGAALQVLANILTFKHLHREIREKGGAYGGGAGYGGIDGLFSFYSYRDPLPLKSLDTFSSCNASFIKNQASWSTDIIDEAKLTIFQSVDAPVSPRQKGWALFHLGVTDEMRQVRREQLLDVTLADIQDVANTYLRDPSEGVDVVLGPDNSELHSNPNWIIKTLDQA